MKQICVIGVGYVGIVTGACFADLGNRVIALDVNEQRIVNLNKGIMPIYEPGLEELVMRNVRAGRLFFTTDYAEAVKDTEFAFIAVGTPSGVSGEADLQYVASAAKSIAENMTAPLIIINKSTVPVGTGDWVADIVKRSQPEPIDFSVVSCPEFLREGSAISDFSQPYRTVLGSTDKEAANKVAQLHLPLRAPIVITDLRTAEMIKYASNSYLATRLTFANTLANLCEAAGADILDVLAGVGLDHRIGPHFLKPGPGYGGSCFPKDTLALIGVAEDAGYDFKLLKAVIEADDEQRRRVATKVRMAAGGGLRGRRIAMWGVAFKAGTDDVRESPATRIARLLIEEGAEVVSYDPEAHAPDIRHADSALEAVDGADVLLIATEWPEFATVDLTKVASRMRGHRIVDARNLLDPKAVRAAGLDYWGLGRPGA